MKLRALFESTSQLLHVQQLLIDALPDEWEVGVDSRWVTLSNPKFPGHVWFGPADYADLPDPTDTRAQVPDRVRENYEDVGPGTVKILAAQCTDVHKCTTRVKVENLTEAFRALCMYNGWTLQDLTHPVTIEDAVDSLGYYMHPAT